MLTWKIAWRNLWRHRGKSLVIGTILFLGALLMTVGNAVIEGAKQGLVESVAERFTGHLALVAGEEDSQNIFFSETIVPLKLIPEYPRLKDILQEQDIVAGFVPMSRGYAMVLNEDGVTRMDEEAGESATMLFGIDLEEYQELFRHNIEVIEGDLLKNGEHGVLISEKDRKKIYNNHDIWVVPQGIPINEDVLPPEVKTAKDRKMIRDELVFLGLSGESLESDIRLPVKGIVRFHSLNKVWIASFVDTESFRRCFGYLTAADTVEKLSGEKAELLTMEDEGDLFAGNDIMEDMDTEAEHYDIAAMQQQTKRSEREVHSDNGAYQFVALKFKPGISLEDGAERLRRMFAEAQMDVKMVPWKKTTGSVVQFAELTQGVLFVFVLFIFFVAAIVITNTLSMAALERTSEIGMMRAIGARKGFISKMFLAEIALLSIIFGGIGMLTGVFVVWGLAALHLPATSHEMVSLLVGGDVLHPIADITGFVFGSGQLAVVTILAAFYPILVARKITPLEAISRE
jgi:putative ABC transport system permease protein